MRRTGRAAHEQQGYTRNFVHDGSPWNRITGGQPHSVLWLRLLPLALVVATLPLAFASPVMVPYANYVIVLLPTLTALVNGAVATTVATAGMVALISAGSGALGWLPYPESSWADVPPIVVVGLLSIALAWIRNRVIFRMLNMTMVAETAQRAIIPDLPEHVGGLKVASAYRTAVDSPGLIGGDFFDVQDTDFGVRAIVGDVQGHDLSTVRLTEALMGAFRERSLDDPDLLTIAARLERRVRLDNRTRDEWGQIFATAAFLEISPKRDEARVVLCGHHAPLLVRDSVMPLSVRPMPPLGLADFGLQRAEFRREPLEPGDLVVAFTDGLIEARNAAGRTFPLVSLLNAHVRNGIRDPNRLRSRLRADFFGGKYQRTDDLTIVILQVPPAE